MMEEEEKEEAPSTRDIVLVSKRCLSITLPSSKLRPMHGNLKLLARVSTAGATSYESQKPARPPCTVCV